LKETQRALERAQTAVNQAFEERHKALDFLHKVERRLEVVDIINDDHQEQQDEDPPNVSLAPSKKRPPPTSTTAAANNLAPKTARHEAFLAAAKPHRGPRTRSHPESRWLELESRRLESESRRLESEPRGLEFLWMYPEFF
jgi:hypothetical protein